MNLKQFFYLLLGFLATSLVYFIIAFCCAAASFTFSSVTLVEKEQTDMIFFGIALSATAISIFVAFKLLKKKKIFVAMGSGIATLTGIAATGIMGYICINNLIYHQSFNAGQWYDRHFDKLDMAKTLVKEKKLIGLSRQEVTTMLGPKDIGYGDPQDNILTYDLNDTWTLHLLLINERVRDAYIYDPGLVLNAP